MGFSYHYKFGAAATATAAQLERFVKKVETTAKKLGFNPTTVFNAAFTSDQQKDFARRLTTGHLLESEKLKGVVLLSEGQVWNHDPVNGRCRVIPERGVVLVVIDERRRETAFGFFAYPRFLKDLNGRDVMSMGIDGRWIFEDFVDSPDPR